MGRARARRFAAVAAVLAAALTAAGSTGRAAETGTTIVKVTRQRSSGAAAPPPAGITPRLVKFTGDRAGGEGPLFEVFWRTPREGLGPGVYVVFDYRASGAGAYRRRLQRFLAPLRGPQRTTFQLPRGEAPVAWVVRIVRNRQTLARQSSTAQP